jgi:hypothetical protein
MQTPARVRRNTRVTLHVGLEADLADGEGHARPIFGLQEDRLVTTHLEAGVNDVRAFVFPGR